VPGPFVRRAFLLLDAAGWRYSVAGERDTCPTCGAREVEHLHPLPLHDRTDGRRVGFASGCRRCGLVFANPMPGSETLAEMYSPAGRWGRTRGAEESGERRQSSRYLTHVLRPVRSTVDVARPAVDSAVLDFGCGAGELLDALQGHGWTTYGIEPAEKGAFARHRELEVIPAAPAFNLAIAHHVLEHVPDPLEILRALHGSLHDGGIVFVSVPRLDTLPRHRDVRYCINDRAHVVSFTRDAMATLLGLAGFEAIDVNPPPDEPDVNWRDLKRLRMLGRKGGSPTSVPDPVAAARRAFADWLGTMAPQERPAWAGMPIRAAAATMNFERSRKRG
jgi:SAM-dependent methyltransferase